MQLAAMYEYEARCPFAVVIVCIASHPQHKMD